MSSNLKKKKVKQKKMWRLLKKLPQDQMEVIMDAAWELHDSCCEQDNTDSYYHIIIDALEECGWTDEEYYCREIR